MGLRDYDKAAVAYEKLLNDDKKAQQYQEVRYDFARSLQLRGKYKEAKEQFESYSK